MQEFREIGRKQFGVDQFDTLCHQIDQIRVRVTFLVCGVDEVGHAHVFSVAHPGIAEVRDDPGYWAIGSGSHAALSLLSFFRQNIVCSLERTIYNVLSAKLMAETSSLVGKSAFAHRLTPSGWAHNLDHETYSAVKAAWIATGRPLVPEGIEDEISRIMASKPSNPQKSEGQP